jgi:ubiquinone/menaquinone biosynthesis C-methylase UbiE
MDRREPCHHTKACGMPGRAVPFVAPAFDRLNRPAYQRPGVLRQYGAASGWLEPGERAAIMSVADAVRDGVILDIGIGGGRTAPLMRTITDSYVGIDYTPALVDLAQHRFPDCDFREMDARRLTFADNAFALVAFSYNGIDSVDLAGRQAILREVHRVLRPGGFFVFSALNRQVAASTHRWPDWTVFAGAGPSPRQLIRASARLMLGGFNHLLRLPMLRDDGAVAIGNISAHNFALVTVFTSLPAQVRQLREAGFSVPTIFNRDGNEVATDAEGGDDAWYHYVARKEYPHA